MKISIFTPTHKPDHIHECYDSIKKQINQEKFDWEFVILTNGHISPEDIPETVRKDPRTKLFSVPHDAKGIGYLKRTACERCTGDLFLELDHDDRLTPNACSAIVDAAIAMPGAFYFSDFINLRSNGTCEIFSGKFGWQQYQCTIEDSVYTASRAFHPTARSLCHIFYAPNHVRVWSRAAYEKSGGHDPALSVGDDHDLVCRTYTAGVPFVYIQEPLYVYRRWHSNSFVQYNKEIQIQQQKNCDKYLHQLIYEECRREKYPFIDIGNKMYSDDGFHNIDIINKGFSPYLLTELAENSVGCIRAFDVLQYLPKRRIIPLMNEIYSVLRPGGWFISSTPSIDDGRGNTGRGAFQNPAYKSYWSENNFLYFTDKAYSIKTDNNQARFQQVRTFTTYPSEQHKKLQTPYVYADLCALKGQRQPGLCKI